MSLKILMVEDDNSVAEMMGMFFKKEGWEQDIAVDGVEAVVEADAIAPASES